MALPDPQTFFGRMCAITLKDGRRVTRKIRNIDTAGVHVEEDGGGVHTYPFARIADVRLAQPATGDGS